MIGLFVSVLDRVKDWVLFVWNFLMVKFGVVLFVFRFVRVVEVVSMVVVEVIRKWCMEIFLYVSCN